MRLINADKLPEHKFTRESAKGSDYMRGWNDAIDAIVDNEPTVLHDNYSMGYQDGVKKVLSERPTGHWIKTNREYKLKDKDNTFVGVYHKCSECGFGEARGGKFCLNCGADMRGDNNGN